MSVLFRSVMDPYYFDLTAGSHVGFKEGDSKRYPLIELWLVNQLAIKMHATPDDRTKALMVRK